MGREKLSQTFAIIFSMLLAAACTVGDPDPGPHDEVHQDPDSAEPGTQFAAGLTVDQAAFSYCSTSAVSGLSRQLIEEIECMRPGSMADISGIPGVSTSAFPYLQKSAADALARATAAGGTIIINSALRSTVQQYVLYKWFTTGRCTHVVSLAAPPGRSNHESGLAVDVGNYGTWRSRLQSQSFSWLGGSDPVHFDYYGGGADLRDYSVRAFQRLYNRNNPGAPIAADGSYGPQTAAAIGRSPAEGFSVGASCGQPPPTTDLAVEVYWNRQSDGRYELRALAPAQVASVEYVVDGYVIGAASRGDGDNFPTSYRFTSETNERQFEVRGYDAAGERVASGVGLIDVTPGTAVYIKQMGAALYEVGLERAPLGVDAIEVFADQYVLTDSVTGDTRTVRGAVRSNFSRLGERRFRITTFNADGSVRGNLYRTFTLR